MGRLRKEQHKLCLLFLVQCWHIFIQINKRPILTDELSGDKKFVYKYVGQYTEPYSKQIIEMQLFDSCFQG